MVYPLERAFEIVDNYVVELAALGLAECGIESLDAPRNLARLRKEGAIGGMRCRNLARIHRVRNELAHEYPDVRAQAVYEAAQLLAGELPGFFRDYAAWMRRLGFGPPSA